MKTADPGRFVRFRSPRVAKAAGPRVAAFGYFGMGNLGNEGSLAAFLDYMRRTHPEAILSCFAAGAEAVQEEHGIPATQLMSYRTSPRSGPVSDKVRKAASRLWDLPRMLHLMRDVDVLVVPGTGVLERKPDVHPWGLPYWLFLATASCRLRGRRVALICVGADEPPHPVTRWLYRWTVRLSDYSTYRDEASRDAVRAMGVNGEPGAAYPDLAFALPVPPVGEVRSGHVVIGAMRYEGAPEDPDRGPGLSRAYVEHMSDVSLRLIDTGHTVTIVVGDLGDQQLAQEIAGRVRTARPGGALSGVSVSKADSLEGLMTEMAAAEVVVATRFHNIICALKLGKPTVSLGYADKNERLMNEFGLGEFSQPVETFDVDLLVRQIEKVRTRHPSVGGLMADTRLRYETELDQLFERLSTQLFERTMAREKT